MDEQEPPQKMKRLTANQKRIARARVKNPDASQREIGDIVGTSRPHVARELAKPHVKAYIRDMMDMSPKLQIPGLLKKLEEGLEATDTKFFANQGEVISERTTIDYATRRAYLDTALELHGARERPTADCNVTNNFFTKEAIEAFVEAFKRKSDPIIQNGHDIGHP